MALKGTEFTYQYTFSGIGGKDVVHYYFSA